MCKDMPKVQNDMTDVIVVSLLSKVDRSGPTYNAMLLVYILNTHFCAKLAFNSFLKMLREMKRSILNVNLKK